MTVLYRSELRLKNDATSKFSKDSKKYLKNGNQLNTILLGIALSYCAST